MVRVLLVQQEKFSNLYNGEKEKTNCSFSFRFTLGCITYLQAYTATITIVF
jgi:hypothetical protein